MRPAPPSPDVLQVAAALGRTVYSDEASSPRWIGRAVAEALQLPEDDRRVAAALAEMTRKRILVEAPLGRNRAGIVIGRLVSREFLCLHFEKECHE